MNKFKTFFRLSIACIWIETVALLSIQFLSHIKNETVNQFVSYVIAGVFWLSMITEQVLFWNANARRKHLKRTSSYRIGLISFWKTPGGKIADVLMAVSSVMILMLIVLKMSTGWCILASISILFLSFQLHCFYNGRNYRFLREYKQIHEERKTDD